MTSAGSVDNDIKAVEEWIRSRKKEAGEIDVDTDLIERRLIDSLALVDFVFLLEELSGRTIDLEGLEVDHFRTLRAIERNFLTKPETVP